jgi:DNA-binding NtrC family response regulator
MAEILLIDDEAVLVKNIARWLARLGHAVATASDAAEGLRRAREVPPDLILLDLRLPDGSGLDLLPKLLAEEPSVSVLMVTAYATVEDAVKAVKLGARDYLQKPLRLDDLRHAVARALEERRLRREVSYYRGREAADARLEALLGQSEAMVQLRAKLQRLTALPEGVQPPTVLLSGETGTGKGLVARTLHYGGPRSQRPFIQVNCAAIPEGLVESELFGHQRGAFTDAKTAKPGLFRAADAGTLFLDEIGAVPLAVQAKILKVIEEKSVRQLGSSTEQSIDVQIVAATNRSLEDLVREGRFRDDLLYRLRVASLSIPPLRERGGDVLLLARKFLGDLARRYNRGPLSFSPPAEQAIAAYLWPGNVRELCNTLDRSVLFANSAEIGPFELGLPSTDARGLALRRGGADELDIEIPDGGIRIADVERAMIASALRKARGSPSAAARLLGLSRDTLRYRIEKYAMPSAAQPAAVKSRE